MFLELYCLANFALFWEWEFFEYLTYRFLSYRNFKKIKK